jgi:hypothetical protein
VGCSLLCCLRRFYCLGWVDDEGDIFAPNDLLVGLSCFMFIS